jgi:hypothetical protein
MDDWNEKQLALMQAGGNAQMKRFFQVQKFPAGLSHKDKYSADATQAYRDRLKKVSLGQDVPELGFIGYTPPKPYGAQVPRSSGLAISSASLSAQTGYSNNDSFSNDFRAQDNVSQSSDQPKKQYQGFGNPYYQQPAQNQKSSNEDPFWSALSSTVSFVSEKSSQALAVVAEKSTSTINSLQTGDLGNKLQEASSTGLNTAKDLGQKSWTALSSFYSTAVKSTQGYFAQGSEESKSYQYEQPNRPAMQGFGSGSSVTSPPQQMSNPGPSNNIQSQRNVATQKNASSAFDGWGFDDQALESVPKASDLNSSSTAKKLDVAPQSRRNMNPSKPIVKEETKSDVDPWDADWGWK